MKELRCTYKKHAHILDGNVVEVKCDSRLCGAERGVVVLHKFDIQGDEPKLIGTSRYADPIEGKEKNSGNH